VNITFRRRRSAAPSAAVRGWRRRRVIAGLTVVALGAGGGVATFMRGSEANPVGVYEPITLADTNYAIPSNAYYVSPAGSDANPGSVSAPFATIAKALLVAPAGSTVVLRDGTYREALTMKRSITLQAFPHEQPWIVGSDIVTGFTAAGSTWTRPWVSTLCHTCFPSAVVDPAFPESGQPEQVFIDGVPLQQVDTLAGVVGGTFYYAISAHQLTLGSDPTGHAVEVTVRPTALMIVAAASGAAVKGIGFARTGSTYDSSAGAMVQSIATGVLFDHDTFAWSATRGLNDYAANSVVTNNLFLYNGSNGFHANTADGLVFQNNRVAFSNAEHFSITPSPYASEGGAKITHTWNGTVIGNLFDDNGANGLWFDVTSTNAVIANNTVLRNAGHGIAYEVSGNLILAGNVVAQNGRVGIKISGVSHAEIWNNTVVGNGWVQLGIYEDPRVDTNPIDNAAGITYDTTNVRVVNNVLVSAATAVKPVFESFDISSPHHFTTAQMITQDDHNLWSRPSSAAPKYLVNWATSLTTSTRYLTLATAQTGTTRENSSIAADNTPSSVLFNDPSFDDYSPAPGSPLNQAGATLPPAVAAAMGVAQSPVQLGAPNRVPPPPPTSTTTVAATPTVPPTTDPPTTIAPTSTTTIPPTTTTTAPALPMLSVADVSMPEGPAGMVSKMKLTITLSKPSNTDVVVDYATTNGTASAATDYRARGGTATFLAGQTSVDIYVKVLGDSTREAAETFALDLAGAGGAAISDGHGVATILNDD
jgi:parallel beta-helix repeat protein